MNSVTTLDKPLSSHSHLNEKPLLPWYAAGALGDGRTVTLFTTRLDLFSKWLQGRRKLAGPGKTLAYRCQFHTTIV